MISTPAPAAVESIILGADGQDPVTVARVDDGFPGVNVTSPRISAFASLRLLPDEADALIWALQVLRAPVTQQASPFAGQVNGLPVIPAEQARRGG